MTMADGGRRPGAAPGDARCARSLLAGARAVIFDFDGVLVDSEPLHAEAIRRVAAENGWVLTPEQFRRMIGRGDEHAFELLARESGRPLGAPGIARLCGAKHAECLALIAQRCFAVQPGVHVLLESLRADGRLLGICSGSREGVVRGMLREASPPLNPYFPVVVTHERVRAPKPDPEGYLRAAGELGVDPGRCVVIEDSPTGIQAGLAAGMTVIAVGHSFEPGRLADAHAIAPRISDLLET